jgi:outer membrane protein assembly factor BamB
MKPPTYEESRQSIVSRGIDIAKSVLNERGLIFQAADSQDHAQENMELHVERFIAEQDLEGAAAALMQNHAFIDPSSATKFCDVLCKFGDDHFYDDHNSEGALHTFQLAAGLNPAHETAVKGVLSVCLHGEPLRPAVALPYMVVLAHLGGRDETAYVMRLIEQQGGSYDDYVKTDGRSEHVPEYPWFTNSGANAQRTGVAQLAIEPPLEIVWTTECGWTHCDVLISGSTVVTGNKKGLLQGFALKTGNKIWEYPLQGRIAGTPAIVGNRVYAGSSARAICLDLHTGDLIWQITSATQPEGLAGMFAMQGCVLGNDDKVVFCEPGWTVLTTDGDSLAAFEDPFESGYHTGACSDGRYFYLPGYRKINRLNPQTCELNAISTDAKITSGPIIAGDFIVFGTNRSSVVAHRLSDLDEAWSFRMQDEPQDGMGFIESRPAFANGRIYFGGTDGNVYALNASNGRQIWKMAIGGAIQSSPALSGDTLYILAPAGFYALSARDGAILWKHPMEAHDSPGSAAIGDELVIIAREQLFAFKNAAGKRAQQVSVARKEASNDKPITKNKPWWKIW